MAGTPDDRHFYMTYGRSRPDTLVPWIEEHDVPLLTNATLRWSEATERLLPMWEYDTRHVIDAGGYNVMGDWVTTGGSLTKNSWEVHMELGKDEPFYPWTLSEYHEWLSEQQDEFAWATVMDYACEERFDALWSHEERMEATLDNTIKHFDKNPDYTVLPVLQGREPDEYVWFYDQLEDYGIPTDHLGLGTVCRMSSEKRIVDFEQEIRERTGVDRLHGFGVKIDAFKHGAQFESADSQAWVFGASRGKVLIDDGNRMRRIDMKNDSLARTVESFKNYYSYVSRLQQGTSAVDYTNGVAGVTDNDAVRDIVTSRYA